VKQDVENRGSRPDWRAGREGVAAAFVGAVLAVGMTWPLVLGLGDEIPGDLDDPLLQAWQVGWIGHAVLHQPLHLFQSNSYWPLSDSLAFTDALIGYAPAGLIAQRGPHEAVLAYDLLFLFVYALAFTGAYLLARELRLPPLAALVTGVAFAYAPWRLTHNGHLNVLSSGGIPLALFLLVRGYRRHSVPLVLAGWAVAAWQMTLGFALGLSFAYLLGALAVLAGVALAARRLSLPSRPVVLATVAGVVGFALVVFLQARPYLRVVDAHPEARRTVAQVVELSPVPGSFWATPGESWFWGPRLGRFRPDIHSPAEQVLFPGLTIIVLALVGAAGSVWPKRLRLGLAAGVAACAVLSLGLGDVPGYPRQLMPYRLLYDLAPGWDGVRTPGRIHTLTSLGLALLAGAGACVVLRYISRRVEGRGRALRVASPVAAAAVLVAAILVEGVGPVPHPDVPARPAAQATAAAPLLHLPWGEDYRYLTWSTGSFLPLVNGEGAFEPKAFDALRRAVRGFPDARSVALLRRFGVRTVLLHTSLARDTPWRRAARKPTAGLGLRRRAVGSTIVYELEQ
jgi:hypothetical protein